MPPPAPLLDRLARGLRVAFGPLASLRLTVVLFALAGLLVWFGTLAQKGQGVWTAVDNYFYSWVAKVEMKYLLEFGKTFFGTRPDATTDWWFPFPGGKSLGSLMAANMIAAYLIRLPQDVSAAIKLGRKKEGAAVAVLGHVAKRLGVYLLHSGVMVLLVGEYYTREFAVEQQMRIGKGESANYAFETRNFEVAFIDGSNPEFDKVAVLPAKRLNGLADARKEAAKLKVPLPSGRVSHPDLPVDVEVVAYFPNSKITNLEAAATAAVRESVPAEQRGGPEGADAAGLLDRYTGVVAAAPKEPPLPLFVKTLDEYAPGKFQSAGGPAVLARIRERVAQLEALQLATAGDGLRYVAEELPEVSGVDPNQQVDFAAVYVNLLDKPSGNSLGIHLLASEWAFVGVPPQAVAGGPHAVELRFTRHYKPYRIHVEGFTADHYPGTSIPKNYSSDVRVDDPAQGLDRPAKIRMNEPLRHRDDALFQSGMSDSHTILQVVTNRGWLLPYVSCGLVGVGMAWHFLVKLGGFVLKAGGAKRTPGATAAPTTAVPPASLPALRYGLPAGVVLLTAAVLAVLAALGVEPKADNGLNLQTAAALPVMEGGRVKPLDTVARVDLRQITHAEEWKGADGKKRTAIEWFFDTAADPDRRNGVGDAPLFRIESDQVKAVLGLKPKEGMRYSTQDIRDGGKFDAFLAEYQKADAVRRVDDKKLDLFQSKVLEAGDHLKLSQAVMAGARPQVVPPEGEQDWRSSEEVAKRLAEARKFVRERSAEGMMAQIADRVKARARAAGLPDIATEEDFAKLTPAQQKALAELLQGEERRARAELEEAVEPVARRLVGQEVGAASLDATDRWEAVKAAYRRGEQKGFEEAVGKYCELAEARLTPWEKTKVRLELFLNQSALYYWCTVLYGMAGVGALVGFVLLAVSPAVGKEVRRGVFWLLLATLAVHTFTLVARMLLMDRPLVFVTNLYSSAVFIGWGVVGLCLLLEVAYPVGFGNLVASTLGVATTIIAHNLAASGDTLEMMRAVLDTNFWLATHVTTVTLGYSATYVAGFLGLIYAVLYVLPEQWVLRRPVTLGPGVGSKQVWVAFAILFFPIFLLPFAIWYIVRNKTTRLFNSPPGGGGTTDVGKILSSLIYATACFAALLSFVGTVLGGIWADQSWGRFWGWDPKENGAVMIVVWNALLLHARWCGVVKERGTAVLAVGGFVVTTWSWFGTNQLGVGLHAYGFNKQLVLLCNSVWIGSLFIVLIGVLPWQWVYRGTAPPLAKRVG